jgi:hypothetical protein
LCRIQKMPPSTFVNAPAGHQAVFEIYRAMQSRLDGYRQSAAAIFIGVLAAILTLDSAFIRVVLDPAFLYPRTPPPDHRLALIVAGAGILLTVVCVAGGIIISHIGAYFAEMTSVIYKIDEANRVWEPGAWIDGEALYPLSFRSVKRVGRSSGDETLVGWEDPMIRRFRRISFLVAVFHLILYAPLVWISLQGVVGRT